MNWLRYLDKKYKEMKREEGIEKNYYFYPETNINTSGKIEILFLKQRKTKYLFKDQYNRKLYLSDADIIEIIIGLENNIFIEVNQHLLKLYFGEEVADFKFEIDDYSFTSKGIYIPHDTQEKYKGIELNTKADMPISLFDLITLINLILAKELQYSEFLQEKKAEVKEEFDPLHRFKRQIVKFVSLAGFYKNKEYEDFLREINYNTDENSIHDVYTNKSSQKIDVCFNDVNKFDKYVQN
ncbi:Uncharacterised protein [Bacillus freudenreichii]|nr:Uncharacterised protein [Bacillus freudenreichii]